MTSAAPQMIVLPRDETPVQAAAEMYAELGFRVLPLHGVVHTSEGLVCSCGMPDCAPKAAGKHPVHKNWQSYASADLDVVRERFRGHRGNIGLHLGDGLVAIDVDGDEGYVSLAEWGDMPSTLTSRSGSGVGEHRIFAYAPHQAAAEVTNRRVAPGLDVKTRAGQIVVAPSMHRSGQRYAWVVPMMPTTLPDAIYERIRKPRVAPVVPLRPAKRSGDVYERARAYVAKLPPAISGSGGHATTFGAARAIAGWVAKGLSAADGWALFCDYNGRCHPPWTERELRHKWDDAMRADRIPEYEDREDPRRASPPRREAEGEHDETVPEAQGEREAPATEATSTETREPTWRERMLWSIDGKGGIPRAVKHPENVVVILRYHPAWAGRVRLDTFAQTVTVREPPWHDTHRPADATPLRPWTDADTVRLSAWIRREIGADLSVEICERAISVAGETSPYHPVREYLESLRWDGTLRLREAPARYLGAEDMSLARHALRWWMIAAVARAFRPGVKADNVLILEGVQGLRKSSALRALASPAWFTDTPIDLQSKDAYLSLQGRWIVELAELESLRGAESSRAKAFFSSPSDTFRPPYGRRMVTVERCCVFAGTCNDSSYLRDQTGNRRYWPILCQRIDVEALLRDRDQLWAEAYEAFQGGAQWWPSTPEEHAAAEEAQAQRTESDEWENVIAHYLSRHLNLEPTVGELLADAIGLSKEDWDRKAQMRVASVLGRLGWTRRQVRSGASRVWRYSAPVTEVVSPTPSQIRPVGDRNSL